MFHSHIAGVVYEPFTFRGELVTPSDLKVSPLIFRNYNCPPNCGGCCTHGHTLDFLPTEPQPKGLIKHPLLVNGKEYIIHTNFQQEETEKADSEGIYNNDKFCEMLNIEDGRCTIHVSGKPMMCDMPPIKFIHYKDPKRPNLLLRKNWGRGWRYQRVDGGVGSICGTESNITADSIPELIRTLNRLKMWVEYFELPSRIDKILHWVETGPHFEPITFRLKENEYEYTRLI